jgi:transcriptional regulator with XRE-family HTH domain
MDTENIEMGSSNGTHLEPIYTTLGARVRRYRKRRHLTIKQVADRAGISYSVLSNLENVRFRTRLDIIEKVAKVLKVDLKTLVG